MGAGAVAGHSTNRGNQIYPSQSSSRLQRPEVQQPSSSRSQPELSRPQAPITAMSKVQSCETCDNNFSFFKRRKTCRDCRRVFCSTCLPKPPSNVSQNGRQCKKCTILTSGKFTRAELQAWRVKDMRCFLDSRNIPTTMCKEKHDLIDLLLLHFCLESNTAINEQREHDRLVGELADRMRNSSFYMSPSLPHQIPDEEENSPPSTPTTAATQSGTSPATQSAPPASSSNEAPSEDMTENEADAADDSDDDVSNLQSIISSHLRERQQREMQEAMQRLHAELAQDEPESRPSIQRATIEDVKSESEVESLSVRQLKEILVNNFVDYKGCCEKQELIDRVKRLWLETQANKERVSAAVESSTAESGKTPGASTAGGTSGAPHDPEKDICKICMDAPIDCILLECGHMITCTKCGKRLADCPICRQYITRVVHVFRS